MPAGRTQIIHLAPNLTVGALSSNGANNANTKIDSSRQQGIKILKIKGSWDADGKTAGEGPVIFGFDIGLAATEVAEAFIADPQVHEDAGSSEEANRKVFPVGMIPRDATGLHNSVTGQLSNSWWRNMRVPTWEIPEGRGLNIFAYNASAAGLTTGTTLRGRMVVLTRWLDD